MSTAHSRTVYACTHMNIYVHIHTNKMHVLKCYLQEKKKTYTPQNQEIIDLERNNYALVLFIFVSVNDCIYP